MEIKNEADLNYYLMQAMQKTIDYVVDRILETNKEEIDRVVYGAGTPAVYERTYEFRDSWTKDVKKTNPNEVTGTMYQDWEEMSYFPETFTHGSYYETKDVRSSLADIIYNGLSGDMFGSGFWTQERNVWRPLINRIQHAIDRWVIEGYAIQGIECRKGGRGIYW